MNYIQLINTYWRHAKCASPSKSATALYFAILDCLNSNNWKRPYKIDNMLLMAMTNMSKSALIRAREELCEKGFLKYITGRKGKSGAYFIEPNEVVFSSGSVISELNSDTVDDTDCETDPDTNKPTHINKIKNNKINVMLNARGARTSYGSGDFFEAAEKKKREQFLRQLREDQR